VLKNAYFAACEPEVRRRETARALAKLTGFCKRLIIQELLASLRAAIFTFNLFITCVYYTIIYLYLKTALGILYLILGFLNTWF
jgi:hypothetical protein